MKKLLSIANIRFALFSVALCVLFFVPLAKLAFFAYRSDLYFYILLVPLVSAYFIYSRKEEAFSSIAPSYAAGALAIACGSGLYLISRNWIALRPEEDSLCLTTASILMIWIGGFVLFYGVRTFRNLAFPLCFLLMMIPLPGAVLGQIVVLLQKGSANVTYWVIKATSLPVTRHGFDFSLSNLGFTVAPQCSGIRSGLYLLMTGLVLSQLYLKSQIRRTVLVLSVLPLAIFKNGLRIVTITLLSNYVNKDILSSNLHRQGGIPFIIAGVVVLSFFTKLLLNSERVNTGHSTSLPLGGQSPVNIV